MADVYEKVVIIGAGGSGRGFLPRLLQKDQTEICFIDKNEELIKKLQEQKEYYIRVGNDKIWIQNYEAYIVESIDAEKKAADADWIFVSVGEEKLTELVPFLKKAEARKGSTLRIVVCENGLAPKNVLRKALREAGVENCLVTQGVIFCTSIPEEKDSLHILSEDYPELPYDADEDLFVLPFTNFPATKNFSQLLQRKIYTYNCLSACIAYLGAYLGYDIYAEAANDPEIQVKCKKLMASLNRTLCKTMKLKPEDQEVFSRRAINKFSNPDIKDTIYKNARAAIRKLAPAERIMGPMQLMEQEGEDVSVLCLTAAAAILYLEKNEELIWNDKKYSDGFSLFKELNPQVGIENMKIISNYLLQLRETKTERK